MATAEHDLGFDGDEPHRLVAGARLRPVLPSSPVRAVPARRHRPPVAWLRQVVDAYGRPRDDGLVDVPLSQAELSAASGRARNCGTVYAYLRALAPVVERGRGGIVVDVARPEELGREHERRRPGAAGGPSGPSFSTPRPAQASAALRLVRRGPSAPDAPATPVEGRGLADLLELLVRRHEQLTGAHRRLVELTGDQHAPVPEAERPRAEPAHVPREPSAKVREPRGTAREVADLAKTDSEVLWARKQKPPLCLALRKAANPRRRRRRNPRTTPPAETGPTGTSTTSSARSRRLAGAPGGPASPTAGGCWRHCAPTAGAKSSLPSPWSPSRCAPASRRSPSGCSS